MREVSAQAHLITRALTQAHGRSDGGSGARAAQAAAVRRLHAARGRGARRDLAQVGAAGDGARRLSRRHRRAARARSRSTAPSRPCRATPTPSPPRSCARWRRRGRGPTPSPTRSSTTTAATATTCCASLLAHHERLGGRAGGAQSIAIVARSGDAQYGELRHYVRRWEALGHRAFIATPEVVRIEDGRAVVDGVIPDLIYRHIFARRLDPASDFARMCLRARALPRVQPDLEPPRGQGDARPARRRRPPTTPTPRASGSTTTSATAVARAVPWTRLLQHGPTTGPDGERIDDLARVDARPRPRSWCSSAAGTTAARASSSATSSPTARPATARLRALLGRAPAEVVDWDALVDFALADRDAWVVQELVRGAARAPSARRRRAAPTRATCTSTCRRSPTSARRRGRRAARVRASESRIVNILGGGGLSPLVREDVLQRLLD